MILMILLANWTQLVMLFSALVFSVVNATSRVTQEVLSSRPKSDDDEIPEHLHQSDLGTASSTSPALLIIRNKFAFNAAPDAGSFRVFSSSTVKLVIIVVSAVLCVAVVLVSAICAFKVLQK